MSSSRRKRKFREMGQKGAARRAKTNSYPLRKVVNHNASQRVGDVEIPMVELECGHTLHPPEDLVGRRYPERMRCWQCAREETP